MPETAAGGGFPFESSLIYYNGTIKKFGKYYYRAHLKEDQNQNGDEGQFRDGRQPVVP